MWVVYILLNKNRNKTYTGSTDNFARRIREHNNGFVKTTKSFGPWVPIYIEFYPHERHARLREKELKTSVGRRYLKKNINRIIKIWGDSSIG